MVAIGGGISLTGIIISSFVRNLWLFIFFYGGFSGIGSGIMYMQPIISGWEHFPDKKGLVTGIIVGSYGMGSFVFSQISTMIINPDDREAEIEINRNLKYFKWEVAERVPFCLRILVLIWAVMLAVGILLLNRPESEEIQDQLQE